MKITTPLVKHLVEQLGLDKKHIDIATRDEAEVRKHAADKIVAGELSPATIAELSVEPEITKANTVIDAKIDSVRSEFASQFKAFGEELLKALKPAPAADPETPATDTSKQTSADLVKAAGGDGASLEDSNVRVKEAVERYSSTRSALLYSKSANIHNRAAFGDAPVVGPDGRSIDEPSNRDKAVAGAWFKHMVNRYCRSNNVIVPAWCKMSEHDRDIVKWAVHNCEFNGPVGATKEDQDDDSVRGGVLKGQKAVGDLTRKALLDDSTSGGLEAVPIEFDNLAVMTSLLNGELMPLVTFQNANRRRMEGYSMGEFTFGNTAEGTGIVPFDTSSFIAAFDTNIYPITGAVEVGLDFLDDSPNDIGAQIEARYGEGFLKKMDDLICNGSGTDEMLGLFQTSGVTTPASSGGSLPYTTSDAELMLATVTKPYRQRAGRRAVFLSNETVYFRFRGIPHGTNEAELRAFGMNYEEYSMLGHPYKINENAPDSATAGFFCMDRYRAYRRAGYSVRVVGLNDAASALKNTQTVVVRARVGGQLELSAAGVILDDLPTS